MALKDIKTNKAYQSRQTSSSTDQIFDRFNPEAGGRIETNSGEYLGNYGTTFIGYDGPTDSSGQPTISQNDYGNFLNTGKKTTTSARTINTVSPKTTTSTSSPTTAANMNTTQTTATIGGRPQIKFGKQYVGDKNLEDIYDPEKNKLQQFDFKTKLSDTFNKGITDKSALYSELMKDGSFASLDSTKQQEEIGKMSEELKAMNDAKKSADMNAQDFNVGEYLKGKGFDLTTGDVREVQKGWDEITQTLKYKGTIYDNNLEDLDFKKQQTIKQINQNVEKIATDVNRSVDDVSRQAQQTLAMGEKVGALKGFGKSSGYVQGLANVQQEAMRNIQRLQQDLARVESLAGEDKALAMQEYEKNMKRAKDDFDYAMRDIISQGGADLNNVMGKYSGKKLGEMLDNVAYDVIQKRLSIESQYINNMKGANDVVNQQFEQYRAMDEYTDKQRAEFTSILNANDGEALASMSAKDIENYVAQGYLSQEQGIAYYNSMVSKSIGALSKYGVPTQQDIDGVINSVKNGLSPLQAIAGVVQNNPNRYSSVKDKFMSVGANSSIFNTQTGQFITAPGSTGGAGTVSTGYTGKTIPPATPEKLNASFTKYTNMKNGSVVRGGQCGMFVNDYIKEATGINGNMFVDPIDVRKTQVNSQTPSVGSVIIMTSSGTPNATKYGHVGIVTGVNADGTVNIKDQNGKIKGAVGTQTLKANDPKIVGYFDPQLGLQSSGGGNDSMRVLSLVQGLGGTEGERAQFADNILKLANKKGISLEAAKKELGYKSGDDVEFAKSRKSQLTDITKSSDAVNKGKQALTVLNNKQTAIGDVAAVVGFLKTIDPSSVARESEVDSVENARGVLETLSNTFTKMDSGKKLTETQRTELRDTIGVIVRAYENNLSNFVTDTVSEFDDRGLDASVYIPKNTLNKYNVTPDKIQKNVAPVQSVLDKLTQQAQAKKTGTTTAPKSTASTSLSARRKTQGK